MAAPKDVFLCHANEDKASVVRPLAEGLRRNRISYWVDEEEIKGGDSIPAHVNAGLAESRVAVVVLSRAFLKSQWPQRELNALINIEASSGIVRILPLVVGDGDAKADIFAQLPLLNDKRHLEWTGDVESIVSEIRWLLSTNVPSRLQHLAVCSVNLRKAYAALTHFLDDFRLPAQLDTNARRVRAELHRLKATPNPGARSAPQTYLRLIDDLSDAEIEISLKTEENTTQQFLPRTENDVASDQVSAERRPSFEAERLAFAEGHSRSEPVFQCRNLSKRFRDNTKFQLKDITLTLRPSEITGVVGANAAGKTTLLRMIAGDLLPDGGECDYPRLQPGVTPRERLCWGLIRQQVAYVQQRPPKWVGELAAVLHREAAVHGRRGLANKKRVEFIIERFGLDDHQSKTWDKISAGFRMRFELARALVWEPKLLVLDEPLAPLDCDTLQEFLEDLREISRSVHWHLPIVISSQHIYEVESVADQLLYLQDGKSEFCGSPVDINKDRTTNIFELTAEVDLARLGTLLADRRAKCIQRGVAVFLVNAPVSVSGDEILSLLLDAGIHVMYFRDASRSIRGVLPSSIIRDPGAVQQDAGS